MNTEAMTAADADIIAAGADTIDLASVDFNRAADEGEWMTLTHPVSGVELTGMRMRLCGADSKRYKAASRNVMTRRSRLRRPPTGEEMEADAIDTVAACVLAWEGFAQDGQPITCSKRSAVEVFNKHRWIYEQADQFIQTRGNFTKKV